MRSRRENHQEVDQDKVIPEEPNSALLVKDKPKETAESVGKEIVLND